MPNWCSCSYVVFGDKGLVTKCYLDWRRYTSATPGFTKRENSWGESWIANLFLGAGKDIESVHCRGGITGLSINDDNSSLRIDMEIAWEPNEDDMFDLINSEYPGLQMVMLAEEPGCEIYINTDRDHKYFEDRWRLEWSLYDETGKEVDEDTYYFAYDEETRVVDFINSALGTKFKTAEEIEDARSELTEIARKLHKNEDNFVSFHEYVG